MGDRHRLLVWVGETVSVWKLPTSGEVMVGRGVKAEIRIEFPAISRAHARFTLQPGSISVVDLGSQNGTRVNGERLTDERPVLYGDIISFGEVTAILSEDVGPEVSDPGQSVDTASLIGQEMFQFGDRTVFTSDPAMKHVYTQLGRLAVSELSVLVRGETGTGKELAATALHFWSKRYDHRLVTLNCAALPDGIAESELFGHARGAFSGATADKVGLIESAHGGTLFLDEIGDLTLPVQGKLLRVLETRRLTRLGSVNERQVDVRIVAATHRALEEGVKAGWFRQDLFYRLNVASVSLPPLRQRRRDLPLLARRLLKDACAALGRSPASLSEGAHQRLAAYSWPGNVRELKNLMEYLAAAVPEQRIAPEHLEGRLVASAALVPQFDSAPIHPGIHSPLASPLPSRPIQQLADSTRLHERKSLEDALAATNGHRTKAAKLLGIPLRTFMDKIKRHGLT